MSALPPGLCARCACAAVGVPCYLLIPSRAPGILLHVVQIVSPHDDGAHHLGGLDNTCTPSPQPTPLSAGAQNPACAVCLAPCCSLLLTSEDTATDGHIASEWALLVDVVTCTHDGSSSSQSQSRMLRPLLSLSERLLTLNGLPGRLEVKADVLVEAVSALAWRLLLLALEASGHADLLLESPLSLRMGESRT